MGVKGKLGRDIDFFAYEGNNYFSAGRDERRGTSVGQKTSL
jgi:hypothetical protein